MAMPKNSTLYGFWNIIVIVLWMTTFSWSTIAQWVKLGRWKLLVHNGGDCFKLETLHLHFIYEIFTGGGKKGNMFHLVA